jgi:Na+/proline symporter
VLFYGMATGVGMLSRIYLAEPGQFDVELALPKMTAGLLPDFWIGIVLAGIFSATMSTADSLILSASAALTHDLLPARIEKNWTVKLATLLTTACALLLALSGSHKVFNLVLFAWSGMASAFAPLLLVYALGGRPTQFSGTLMMVVGLTVAIAWRWCGLHQHIYEGMPGMLAGLLVFCIHQRLLVMRYPATTH